MESQNIAVFVDRMVVLPIHNIGDALNVAAEPGKSERIKVALAPGGIDGIVDGVIGDRGSDGAGDDSVQRAPSLPRSPITPRLEEHTSELQSLTNLVCRLLL